jgi:Domain of unknown function (DUF4218)
LDVVRFDCHRRFLPRNHRFRKEKNSFRRDTVVTEKALEYLTGDQILHERIFEVNGLQGSVESGGEKYHRKPNGFGVSHNWYKRSIFWELPYWDRLTLRHNLDVMHIEKNFFDNIINTVLHVSGRTKDTVNSRIDLKRVCRRPELELRDGKAPVPIFRVLPQGRNALMKWLTDEVKFPDGYASKIGRCVDIQGGKLQGMKSHDCHVFMERLIPIAFKELLHPSVHLPLCGISKFFKDICSKDLRTNDVEVLKQSIPEIICALEKVFGPSFFDVMEHLPVHLPDEALLGGPVQFRWMYPFERMFFHLKKKARNKAQVEGSIVRQYQLEEISYFTDFYFEPGVQTKGRRSQNAEDTSYLYEYLPCFGAIPSIFIPTGRLSGASMDYWLQGKEYETLHTYILLNCDELRPIERYIMIFIFFM